MSNPFDLEAGRFLVLANNAGQFSLWPQGADMPGGWGKVFGPDSKQVCLEYIDREWTNIRAKPVGQAGDNRFARKESA
ncbi:hypothetical protein ASC97_31905 [Rhizobium sp. Root1203]|uniref:MbtH family protein n=1 Tax=Rhizobium sp. Root1203 TaxID=1736427 RepID=UPI00070B791A|nr:MbtH family protein [Rhizobium sp. Root1203]KQV13848.1 hypothetical protein ASC97_31905 [Rhizobium sp. Root1203]